MLRLSDSETIVPSEYPVRAAIYRVSPSCRYQAMMLKLILRTLRSVFRSRQSLVLENAALRHQIVVLHRNGGRPRLRWCDRAF